MNKRALEADVAEAAKQVEFWEDVVQQRRRTASGFLSRPADKEDLWFAEGKLSDARAQLREAQSRLHAWET